MENRRIVEKSHDIAEIKHEHWNSHDLDTPHGGRNPAIHYRFLAGCSHQSLSTFSLPERIAGPEKRGAKSAAFEITRALSVRLIWSRGGEGDSHQIWRIQIIQVTVASLRLFLRSSTGPNRPFQPQSLGRVRDPVRIAEGPTAIDAA